MDIVEVSGGPSTLTLSTDSVDQQLSQSSIVEISDCQVRIAQVVVVSGSREQAHLVLVGKVRSRPE
jgi:hypothetical protein